MSERLTSSISGARPSHTYHRGFTLVELMVAMTGALFLSASVFMVAKQTTGLYQEESRAANANLTSIVGFERLRADLARAGFMASPNIATDSRVCGSKNVSQWPPMLQQLQSITFASTADLPNVYAENGLAPQEVVIAGNFTSAEAIPVRSIEQLGSNVNVYLQVASGAMARLGFSSDVAVQEQVLQTTFPTGRLARIVDRAGRHHYGLITGIATSPPTVTLSTTSAIIQFRDGSSLGCGIHGNETGSTINTVNFIRYRIGAPSSNDYDAVLNVEADLADYQADRRELLRVELDPTSADGETLGPEELIAEYAMDLQFRVTVQQLTGLEYINDAEQLFDWAGPGKNAHMVRSIHAWLSVRSRQPDRSSDIPVETGPRYRVQLAPNVFARMRTVQSRIALHNQ